MTQKFTGKERDQEIGLDFFEARYTSAAQGRFLSADWSSIPEPVPYADFSDPQSLNLYAYTKNNPLTRIDPDGHEYIDWSAWFDLASYDFDWFKRQFCNIGFGSCVDEREHGSAKTKKQLIEAQDAARRNPKFQPKGKTTFCNQATCAIAKAMGAALDPLTDEQANPHLANDIAENLAGSKEYRQISPEEAQSFANSGGLVIVAYRNKTGPGHVATVRPQGVGGDDPPEHGRGPLLNDIGRNVRVANENFTFRKGLEVRYYAPNGK